MEILTKIKIQKKTVTIKISLIKKNNSNSSDNRSNNSDKIIIKIIIILSIIGERLCTMKHTYDEMLPHILNAP